MISSSFATTQIKALKQREKPGDILHTQLFPTLKDTIPAAISPAARSPSLEGHWIVSLCTIPLRQKPSRSGACISSLIALKWPLVKSPFRSNRVCSFVHSTLGSPVTANSSVIIHSAASVGKAAVCLIDTRTTRVLPLLSFCFTHVHAQEGSRQ